MSGNTKDITRRNVCAALGLAGLSALGMLCGCAPHLSSETGGGEGDSVRPVTTLKICANAAFDYALCGYYIALVQGFFRAEALEIVEVEPADASTRLEMVNQGVTKICFTSQDELVPLYAIDEPASIEAVAALVQPQDDDEGYRHIVVANDLFLVAHEESAWGFLSALERGYRYCFEQTVEAAHDIASRYPEVDVSECANAIGELSSRFFDDGGAWGTIESSIWDKRNAALLGEGAIDAPVYPHHGFNLDYLPSAESTS